MALLLAALCWGQQTFRRFLRLAAINAFGLLLLRTPTDGNAANAIASTVSVSPALALGLQWHFKQHQDGDGGDTRHHRNQQ
jgi:hypothetical protein